MTDDTLNPAAAGAPPAVTVEPVSAHAPPDGAAPGLAPQIAPGSPLEAMRETHPDLAEALRREWGNDFDINMAHAGEVAKAFLDTDVRELLDQTGLGDDPRIVRLAANIGRALSAGAAPHGSREETYNPETVNAGAAPAAPGRGSSVMIQAEIDKCTADPTYWTEPVQKHVRQLYLQLHGSRPIGVHRAPGDGGAGW